MIHVFVFVSYSLDIGHGIGDGHGVAMAWLCVIHPPSIFTLFASPVAFLRRAPPPFSHNVGFITLSIGRIFERLFYEDCMTLFMVWFHIDERLFMKIV